jgi:hypothetical protein
VAKNLLVISIVTILLAHNVFSLYPEAFFCGDSPLECSFTDASQPDILTFTEEGSEILYQFIFDSEFKNINASTNIFEEHDNLNFSFKCNSGCLAFTLPTIFAGMNFGLKHLSTYFSLPNRPKQELYTSLHCFRI